MSVLSSCQFYRNQLMGKTFTSPEDKITLAVGATLKGIKLLWQQIYSFMSSPYSRRETNDKIQRQQKEMAQTYFLYIPNEIVAYDPPSLWAKGYRIPLWIKVRPILEFCRLLFCLLEKQIDLVIVFIHMWIWSDPQKALLIIPVHFMNNLSYATCQSGDFAWSAETELQIRWN